MLLTDRARRATNSVGVRIRRRQFLGHHAIRVRHARDVEKGDLNRGLEFDEEQVQQVEFVLRRLGVEANDFAGETVGGPRLHGDGAEPAATRDHALGVDGARGTAAGGERVRDESHAPLGRQGAIGRGECHARKVASPWRASGARAPAKQGHPTTVARRVLGPVASSCAGTLMRHVRHPTPQSMPYLKSTAAPATDIYFEDSGGSGQAVVLIHGWPLSHAMWEGQVNALTAAGHRCVTYDRRGFGDSGHATGGYDYDTFASDLNDLLNELDLRNVVLVGFSMGGGEVARYIGRYGEGRVAKAVLMSSVTPYLLKTDDNPSGVPQSVFDEMLAGVTKDRINFLADFTPKFFKGGLLAPGASDDVIAFSKSIAWRASPLGHTAVRRRVQRDRFPARSSQVHGPDAYRPRRQRPDRADRPLWPTRG